ncbi:MAG: M23 family metallopeptidase [Thermoleophilaceae bacterium]|nr:M23 family metallopeptidase [Thermoleophilaceae bacterium]
MLIRSAQPTSLRNSRAASTALATAIAVFLTLTTPNGAAAADGGTGAWPWPVLGEVITPYKNGSDRYAAGQHRGLDIAAPAGTQVRAIVDGRVSFAGALPDGGVTVTLRSRDGAYLVSALHLATRSVARGDSVTAGALLGAVGTTGRRSVAEPHLHLSVRRAEDRSYLDPMTLLGAPRLPATLPAADAPVPAAQSVAPAKQSPEQEVRDSSTGREARSISSVHAQATGDSSSASRHGASGRPTTADSSAGARAREGHAVRHVSRVAPPPLQQPAAERPNRVAAEPVEPVSSEPAPVAAQSGGGSNRLLLLAVAAVCLIALAMRRKPREIARHDSPPSIDAEQGAHDAEVIPLHRAS